MSRPSVVSSRPMIVVLAVLLLLATPLPGAADDDARPISYEACDGDTAARLTFLEERLEAARLHGAVWSWGWLAFHTAGMTAATAQAATEDDDGKRANNIASAIKGVLGITLRAVRPASARKGADELEHLPPDSPDACRSRLLVAEELMRRNARESSRRYTLFPHVSNVLFNVGVAVLVTEAFDSGSEAWQSAGISIAIAEVMFWSRPWQARGDLAEYERSFPADGLPKPAPVTWHIAPRIGGASLQVRF